MPTGYTAPVKDGKIDDFPRFALTCARAFGPFILLRDHDQSLKTTLEAIADDSYLEGGRYEQETIKKAETRLSELRAMTDKEALAAAQEAANEQIASNERYEQTRLIELGRYQAMIEKVEAWTPPTEDHRNFKEFMLTQLRESIDFDCRHFEMPVPEVSLRWRVQQIEREEQTIERCKKQIQESEERNRGRKAWVEALVNSLGEPVAA